MMRAAYRIVAVAIALIGALVATAAWAQSTSTATWSSAGVANQAAMPNPTTVTAADSTTVRLDYSSVTNGGSFVPVYGGSFVTYYSGQLGSAPNGLVVEFDNDAHDPGDKVTLILTLSRPVTGLTFSITDVDAGTANDAVSVEYDTGSGVYQNAANNTAFYTDGFAVARTNDAVVNGWRGTSASADTSTAGNVDFDFGTTTVQRIRITYFSYTGSGNPSSQYIGVTDLTFDNPGAVGNTRTAGTPPALVCPAGTVLFDWDTVSWAGGSTANSYPLSTLGQISFSIANQGTWLSSTVYGGPTPRLQSVQNGGFTGQNLLITLVDLPNRSAEVVTTINLPFVTTGAQFRIADVDFIVDQLADRVKVEGRYKGATVIPTLTNGVSNYVVGNSAYGDGAADNGTADGNVVVTFSSPIDQIVVHYGSHTTAPADPGQQAVSFHDFTFCKPTTTMSLTKVSTPLSDPFNGTTNPKMIPGATATYCLLVTNTGDNTATEVVASDPLPAKTTYVPGSMTSGATCATATTAEDDDAAGADETDPAGGSFASGTLTATTTSLAAGATFALKFRVTIN